MESLLIKYDMKNLVGYRIEQMVFSSPTTYMFFFCVHICHLVVNVFSCRKKSYSTSKHTISLLPTKTMH